MKFCLHAFTILLNDILNVLVALVMLKFLIMTCTLNSVSNTYSTLEGLFKTEFLRFEYWMIS